MGDFFACPGWFGAWMKAFGSDHQFCSLSVAGQVIPFLIVRSSQLGIPLCYLRAPVNGHSPLFTFPLDGGDDFIGLAESFRQSRHKWAWDWLQLELVPWDSGTQRIIMELKKQGWSVLTEEHPHTAMVDIGEDWEAYSTGGMSKKLRTNTNRAENGLKRQGEMVFEECGGSSDWLDCLEAIFALEAQGWKGQEGSAINCKPLERQFYTDVLHLARERNALRLYTLRLDGDMIAANIMIIEAGTAYGWKTAYRPDLAKFSPGNVLQRYVLHALYQHGDIQYLDMLDPATDWKRRWATRVEPRAFIRIFAPTVKGRLLYHVAKWRVVRWQKASSKAGKV